MQKNIKIKEIIITQTNDNFRELFKQCKFCSKLSSFSNNNLKLCEKLSGPEDFYCPFCLRHGFNTKNSKHILVLSLRSIISYYYNELYLSSPPKIFLSQILDKIELHQKIGLNNPVFSYDSETFLWFVNFQKVGQDGKRISVKAINDTIEEMIEAFELKTTVAGFGQEDLFLFQKKFFKAIDLFYSKRKRPSKFKFLIPTLQRNLSNGMEPTREFFKEDLKLIF